MRAVSLIVLAIAGCQTPALVELPGERKSNSVQDRLTDAMLARLLSPLNRWLEATGVEPVSMDRVAHYALVIRPEEPGRCPTPSFRFQLDYANEHLEEHHYSPVEPWILLEERPAAYASRKVGEVRSSVRTVLLMAFETGMDDYMETLATGTPMFCRMPTEHSPIDRIRPEDVIYSR